MLYCPIYYTFLPAKHITCGAVHRAPDESSQASYVSPRDSRAQTSAGSGIQGLALLRHVTFCLLFSRHDGSAFFAKPAQHAFFATLPPFSVSLLLLR